MNSGTAFLLALCNLASLRLTCAVELTAVTAS